RRRRAAARLLLDRKEALARRVVERFYEERPEASARWGDRGRRFCLEDTRYHLQYLAAALEFRLPRTFVQYVAWIRDVLEARGVDRDHLRLTLRLLAEALEQEPGLSREGLADALEALRGGAEILDAPPARS
ncbi:MAG TPA: hypothetical protein VNZ52_02810, partial [Candidatus Thermoplasmatota archaeon]|nr:hypothetical protein [Candidatus Thermoplasmatota archaeon]